MKTIVQMFKRILAKSILFKSSSDYWDKRYSLGGNSGQGSYNEYAEFKAEFLNEFAASNNISNVIEFGCGDGNQLKYFEFPKYHGFDVSPKALELCNQLFDSDQSKLFSLISNYNNEKAELVLSLDVIFHLVEDVVFEDYLKRLFNAGSRYVIIYSSDSKDVNLINLAHVKHRNFTKWIDENISGFKLKEVAPTIMESKENSKTAQKSFFIYEKLD